MLNIKFRTAFLTTAMAIVIGGFSMPSFAEEAKTIDELPPGTEIKTVENPKMDKVRDLAEKLASDLSTEEVDNLAKIRDGFGMIRSAQLAQDTVDKAIKACVDENSDMAEAMEARHEQWETAIDIVVNEQQQKMDNSLSQTYFSNPDVVEDYLDAIDDAAEYADANIEKKIITTETACQNLLNSMDKTQKTIVGMLSDITWPTEPLDTSEVE